MKRVQMFIHVAVVTSRDRFLVSCTWNHFTLEAVKLRNQRFSREKIYLKENSVNCETCVGNSHAA